MSTEEKEEARRRLVRQLTRAARDHEARISNGAQNLIRDAATAPGATSAEVTPEAVGRAVEEVAGGLISRVAQSGTSARAVLRPRLIQKVLDYLLTDQPPV